MTFDISTFSFLLGEPFNCMVKQHWSVTKEVKRASTSLDLAVTKWQFYAPLPVMISRPTARWATCISVSNCYMRNFVASRKQCVSLWLCVLTFCFSTTMKLLCSGRWGYASRFKELREAILKAVPEAKAEGQVGRRCEYDHIASDNVTSPWSLISPFFSPRWGYSPSYRVLGQIVQRAPPSATFEALACKADYRGRAWYTCFGGWPGRPCESLSLVYSPRHNVPWTAWWSMEGKPAWFWRMAYFCCSGCT